MPIILAQTTPPTAVAPAPPRPGATTNSDWIRKPTGEDFAQFYPKAAAAANVDIGAAIKRAHEKGWRARDKAGNEEAYGYYTKATEAQPSSADAWFQLGLFQLATRNCARAAYEAFNRATALDPRNPIYNAYYAQTLARVNSGKPRC